MIVRHVAGSNPQRAALGNVPRSRKGAGTGVRARVGKGAGA